MTGERRIDWAPSSETPKYRTEDDDPTGGNFVVAEDVGGSTVLLQWNDTTSQWEFAGDVDLGSNDITNVGSINTDSATINGLAGVPLTDEESGSPYTATGSNSANSINPSSLDSFDTYIIYLKFTDQASSVNDVRMQVGGDTGSNYKEAFEDGSINTGETEWGPLSRTGGSSTWAIWSMLWQREDGFGMSVLTTDARGSADSVVSGRNGNVSWPPSQFTFKRGADTDWEVRIWGRDI